jgi:glutaconate CoA-transferase subunit A
MTIDDVVAELSDGMTVGIGGWGSRRKPMALVRAIARSSLKDLHIVSYGGPDVGILCATGQASKVTYGFVSLDTIPLEPHFRAARQNGTIEAAELDEGFFQWGLYAASLRLPFLPTRAGLGSDMLVMNPELKTVTSPYDDGEELVAAKAINLDVALVHLNRSDQAGNAQFLGPDLYFDDLFCGAAARAFVTTEKVVPTEDLLTEGTLHTLKISRRLVTGVVEAPGGAPVTSCDPDNDRDEAVQREYAASAHGPDEWKAFREGWIDLTEDEYQERRNARTDGGDA